MKAKRLFKHVFNHKETLCNIISDKEKAISKAILSLKHHRVELDKYVKKNPKILYSLEPIPVKNEPLIVSLMAKAAKNAHVGPMAAVAGVLADLAVKDMKLFGSKVAVVENGGEVSAFSNEPIDVGLSAGDSILSEQLAFRLRKFPIGIATSSGLYSHALSFGESEAVTIFAKNAGIADAAATAIGNLILGKDHQEVIKKALNKALCIKGVSGAFVLYKGIVGKAGQIPQIINCK